MVKKLRVLYDRDVLRPQESVDLEADTFYDVTIHEDTRERYPDEDAHGSDQNEEYPLAKFTKFSIETGISDLAEQHDHYL
jgi:hypothetical protein